MLLNLTKVFWFRHKRRRYRKRGRKKHLQKFFNTRRKKYSYYYKKCVFYKFKIAEKTEKNEVLIHSKKSYNIGIKLLNSGIIDSLPLKSLKFVSQRFMRSRKLEKYFRHNSIATPDFNLTAKPKAIRMGKGKGPVKHKISFIKKGLVVFNVKYNMHFKKYNLDKKLFLLKINIFMYLLLLRLKTKLPFKTSVFKKNL